MIAADVRVLDDRSCDVATQRVNVIVKHTSTQCQRERERDRKSKHIEKNAPHESQKKELRDHGCRLVASSNDAAAGTRRDDVAL